LVVHKIKNHAANSLELVAPIEIIALDDLLLSTGEVSRKAQ